MTIQLAEEALVQQATLALECFGLSSFTVSTGPGDWDGEYLKTLLADLPAVRVVFDGANADGETELTLESAFSLIVAVGWKGGDEPSRRLGDQGCYAAMQVLITELHNTQLTHTAPNGAATILGLIRVDAIENLWTGAWNRAGISVYSVGLDVQLPLDSADAPGKELDDFLRAGVALDIEGGDDPDAEDVLNVRP